MQSLNPPNDDNISLRKVETCNTIRNSNYRLLNCPMKLASRQLQINSASSITHLPTGRRQRKARGEEAFVGSGNKMMPLSEKDRRIKELEAELRETRRANDILKEALGFFAQSRKK